MWAAGTSVVSVVFVWKYCKAKKDISIYTRQMEQWLDDIILEKEIKAMDENEETLLGKMNEKLRKLSHIWDRKEKEAQDEKRKLKELISDISHQTRTPVANIKIYMEMLWEEPLSVKEREFLQNVKQQTDKLDFLIQSMVKMSRMETGLISIQRQRTNLYDTLGKVITTIVPKAEQKKIELFVKCEENILISYDKRWTEEALFNILDNAVKYTGESGMIQIEATVGEIYTKISIRDSGKGIAVERQAEIFKRFYREPEVHNQEGVGIGLYLARKIIELQGGYIEVHSVVGQGSDFKIYLPNESSQNCDD